MTANFQELGLPLLPEDLGKVVRDPEGAGARWPGCLGRAAGVLLSPHLCSVPPPPPWQWGILNGFINVRTYLHKWPINTGNCSKQESSKTCQVKQQRDGYLSLCSRLVEITENSQPRSGEHPVGGEQAKTAPSWREPSQHQPGLKRWSFVSSPGDATAEGSVRCSHHPSWHTGSNEHP